MVVGVVRQRRSGEEVAGRLSTELAYMIVLPARTAPGGLGFGHKVSMSFAMNIIYRGVFHTMPQDRAS